MGNYNMQYQNYYSTLNRKKRSKTNKASNGFSFDRYIKIFTYQLIGVLILMIFFIGCKAISISQTKYILNYSHAIIDENYDYKNINFNEIEKSCTDWIEELDSEVKNELHF